MLEGLEIVGISRVGHDYALHFSNGAFGIFSAEDLEQMLGCNVSSLIPVLHSDEIKPRLH